MRSDGNLRRAAWLLPIFSLLVCFGVWRWAGSLLIPHSTRLTVGSKIPIGNNSDLYPRWLGARELLLHHRNPYGADITREIQAGYYGRPLDPSRPNEPTDQQAFAYPLYVVFLMAPSIFLPFSTVMQMFGWLLLGCVAGSVVLWIRALGLHWSVAMQLSAVLLVLGCYPVLQAFYKQQLTLFVGLLLAAAALSIIRGGLGLSGILLGLSTIKPQISALLIFWLLIWAIGDLKNRKRLLWSFAGTMAALVVAAEALLPGWIRDFLMAIQAYRQYASDEPILGQLLTHRGGEIAAALLLLTLAAVCWQWRKQSAGSACFGWAMVLALTINLTILDKIAPYNDVLLIPPVLALLVAARSRRGWAGAAAKAALACQVWQWLTALLLVICSFVITPRRLEGLAEVPLYTIFALTPLTLLAVLLCLPRGAQSLASGATPRIPSESRG